MSRLLYILAIVLAVASTCVLDALALEGEATFEEESRAGCEDCSQCIGCRCCPILSTALPASVDAISLPIERPLLACIPTESAPASAPVDIFHPPKA
jgi:hypothetical protein